MPKVINLRKGLDIKLLGEAVREMVRLPTADSYGISPSDFEGLTPKLLVKAGDSVKAGSPLLFDKNRPEIVVTSPVSGTVAEVRRGDKRRILEVVVNADRQQSYERFEIKPIEHASKKDVTASLLASGLWTCVIQRPYGIVADPDDTPKAIFVSGFDSAPLAPDMSFALADQYENLNKGITVLNILAGGSKVHLGVREGCEGIVSRLKDAEIHRFSGPHPAGNVGVQINRISPVNKGEVVWTVDIQNVAVIGRLFNTGMLDMTRVFALTGSEVEKPLYVCAMACAPFASLLRDNIRKREDGGGVRIISGNVLTGRKADPGGCVGYYANQITVIPEGDKYEMLGWAMPRLNKFSVSHSYFSWLTPKKRYALDTNLNGGRRPYIVTGLFEKYLPMDIYPMYLLKAILAGDIDKMENLGIYEVVEEDLALCEFVDPSKNEIQKTIRDGINLMIKELN